MDDFSVRMRNYTAPNPSSRNPRISKDSNHADLIEQQMDTDGHQLWGFVVYRTTYNSDPDWDEFLRRLRYQMQQEMDFYGGQDILDRFQLTVFDDRALFDGVDTAAVRRHFRQWAETAFRSEQRLQHRESSDDERARVGMAPRYRFCVQVDADALHSVVHVAPPPEDGDVSGRGWVKLINKSWVPRREDPRFAGRSLDPTVYDAVEGETEEDVGWLKCPYSSVMIQWYVYLRGLNGWVINYRRPPLVAGCF